MVPATPGSELKKRIEEKWKTLGVMQKVKVIEKPGKKFGDVLKMNNRSQKSKRACTDERCLVGDKGGNCRTNKVVYRITCKVCNDVYIGESSRKIETKWKYGDGVNAKNVNIKPV